MHYQLWDVVSGNLVEDFASESEALAAVRDLLAVNELDRLEGLVLGARYDHAEPDGTPLPPVLQGAALLARARETVSEPASTHGSRRVPA